MMSLSNKFNVKLKERFIMTPTSQVKILPKKAKNSRIKERLKNKCAENIDRISPTLD